MDKRAHKDVTNTQEMTFFFFFKIHFIIPYVHFDFRILAVLKSPRAHRMAASVAGEAVSAFMVLDRWTAGCLIGLFCISLISVLFF